MKRSPQVFRALLVACAATSFTACSDEPTAPSLGSARGLGSRRDDVLPTAMDFSPPAPANSLTPADAFWRSTGIVVPAGVGVRVRASGVITAGSNPTCTHDTFPGNGVSYDVNGYPVPAGQPGGGPSLAVGQAESISGRTWGHNGGINDGAGTYTWYTEKQFAVETQLVFAYTATTWDNTCWENEQALWKYSFSGTHNIHADFFRVMVTPSSPEVTPGQVAHFVMTSQNYDIMAASGPARTWSFISTDQTYSTQVPACTGQFTCDFAPPKSGYMILRERPTANDDFEVLGAEVLVRPPLCPPTNDPILDDPVVRRGLDSAFQVSGADLPQGQRHEHAGIIVQYASDGHREVIDINISSYDCMTADIPPERVPQGSTLIATWHTHPTDPPEKSIQCGPVTFPAGAMYLRGPSEKDWLAFDKDNARRVQNGEARVPEYVYDKRRVYRMKPNVPPFSATNPQNDFTTTVHDRPECRWL